MRGWRVVVCCAPLLFSAQVWGGTTPAVTQVNCTNSPATDNARLAAAAALGGSVSIVGNCTISQPIVLISNTVFNGNQYTITAAAAALWSGAAIANAINVAANATQITIENTNFNWTGAPGSTKVIAFNNGNTSKLAVLNNVANPAPGDFVAFVNATDVTVIGNKAYGCGNACFDHWFTTGNVVESNNVASLTSSASVAAYGFIYTSFDTNNTVETAAIRWNVSHNTVYINAQPAGGQVGIYIQGWTGSCGAQPLGTNYETVSDNQVSVASGIWGAGIRVDGCSNYIDIHDNIITSDGLTTANLPAIEANGPSSGVHIHDNIAFNWLGQTGGSDAGVFTNKGPNGSIRFNNCYGTCSSPLTFVNASVTQLVMGNGTGTGTFTMNSPNLLISGTAPTISSGFGTGASVTQNNGSASFSVNVGTGGAASSGVVGLPTAAHGWACAGADVTTPATNMTQQTGSSTTTATFTNYVRTTGVAGAWPASDILEITCFAN